MQVSPVGTSPGAGPRQGTLWWFAVAAGGILLVMGPAQAIHAGNIVSKVTILLAPAGADISLALHTAAIYKVSTGGWGALPKGRVLEPLT